VPNNGGYETTPEEEWNFVVNLDLAKTYPGGRRGTKLNVYNLAHGAQKHGGHEGQGRRHARQGQGCRQGCDARVGSPQHSGQYGAGCGCAAATRRAGHARLDIPLDSADNRLAEVAKQNACSTEELVDSVKTVGLRWGRASCLSEDPLTRAIKKLGETQEDHSDTIRGLDELVKLGAKTLKELGKMLGEALEKAPRVETTGERSFAAVAEGVKDLASREMLEALSRYSRTKLMEAKACEEDVVGLRLYTGALRSRSCSRALSFPYLLVGLPPPRRGAGTGRGRLPRSTGKRGQPFGIAFAPLSLSHTHTQPLYIHAYISSLFLLHRYVSIRPQTDNVCYFSVCITAHRETEANFTAAGMSSQTNNSEALRFKRAAFYQGLQSKVGLAAAKAAALRINLNAQGCVIVATPMHAPSRTPLLLPPFFHTSPYPPRSLVRGGQPSPHKPRLVVSRSTCPPLSSPPTREQLCNRSCSNKTHTCNRYCSKHTLEHLTNLTVYWFQSFRFKSLGSR